MINGGLDNNNLAPGFKRTTSAYAGGPPGSPTDGDIWVATAVEGGANRWSFQYEAAWVTDAYKWKFIGGSFLVFMQDGSLTTTSASLTAGTAGTGTVAGTQYTPSRSGMYQCRASANISITTVSNTGIFGIGAAGSTYNGTSWTCPSAGGYLSGVTADVEAACTSGGNTINPVFATNGGTATLTNRRLVVIPSRII